MREVFRGAREIALNQLVSVGNAALSDSERGFMQGRSRCDFVLYYRVGKKPLGVIEVDGASHMHPQQREWDRLKNGILQKGGLPLLRLNTTDSHIEAKIERFIHSAIGEVLPDTVVERDLDLSSPFG